MRKILVSRTDRIGDLILSTPVFETLKNSYPDCHLTALVTETTQELLKYNPWVDDTISYKPAEFFRLIRRLRKFEVAIILHPTFTIAFLCWISRVKLRIGTAYRAYSFFFNRRVYEHRKDCKLHEAEYNMNLLKPLGIEGYPVRPRVWISEAERKWARQRLEELGRKRMIAALHPGSGGSSRRWGEANFARLGEILAENGFDVLLTGGKGEERLIERVISQMNFFPPRIVGEADLLQLAAIFTQCAVLVTNSTGPMHLAASCGVPVIGIFCPIAGCSPERWGPLGEHTKVLIPDVPTCKRCVGNQCEYYDCMDRLKPEMVMVEVEKLLINMENRLECQYRTKKPC